MKKLALTTLVLSTHLSLLASPVTELEYEVQPPVDSPSVHGSYELRVKLSPKMISTEAHGVRVDRDFSSGRLVETDSSEGATRDDSLFAPLAFRLAELENRKMIAKVLSQVGHEEGIQSSALLDHTFSVDSGSSSEVERRSSPERVSFSWGGKCLAEYSPRGPSAPSSTVSQFSMFLRHEYGLHPKILSELQSLDYIPSEIVVCLHDPTESRRKLTLKGKKTASSPTPSPKLPPPPDRLYSLGNKVASMPQSDLTAMHSAMLQGAITAASAGQNLEAMALLMSYASSTGKTPQELSSMKDKFMSDPDVKILLGAVSPSDESSAKRSLLDLEMLEEKMLRGKPMLKVFRANITAALGGIPAATELFLDALELEPGLTGAWFDLGAAYHAGFDTRSAWKCYDSGRRISPDHPAATEVEKLETKMRNEHPEFFM